jgi:hypothetical protein
VARVIFIAASPKNLDQGVWLREWAKTWHTALTDSTGGER